MTRKQSFDFTLRTCIPHNWSKLTDVLFERARETPNQIVIADQINSDLNFLQHYTYQYINGNFGLESDI